MGWTMVIAASCASDLTRFRRRAVLKRLPHLDIALGGPDARVVQSLGLVIGAGDVEWHAVLEDHPVAVFRPHLPHRVVIDLLEAGAPVGTRLGDGEEVGGEGVGAGDTV